MRASSPPNRETDSTPQEKVTRTALSLLKLANVLDNVNRDCQTTGQLPLQMAMSERNFEFSEDQIRLLERFRPEFRERYLESPHTGSLVPVDTFLVGTLNGGGQGASADHGLLPLSLSLGTVISERDAGRRSAPNEP